jgi:hypothetical protein
MRNLTAVQLLEAWEQGSGQPPVQRALVLIAAACPEEPVEALAGLSIGQRDARLLSLRELTFGTDLASVADCPACGEHLEMNFRTGDLRVESRSSGAAEYRLDEAGYQVCYRLPNSLDLLAAQGNPKNGQGVLLERCVLAVTHQAETLPANRLPTAVIARIGEQMRADDPQAEVELKLTCPACGHIWTTPFDILAYFWSEIEAWNTRTLQEVHRLARAYGWSEAAILGMSAWRRRRYLEMI